MSTDLFIPTVWSEKILHRLKIALVYASPYVVNHDYEGDIAEMGDSVKIHGISDPTISPYVKNTDMADPEVLEDFEVQLIVDQGDSFNFQVDDVDKRQAQPQFMGEAMDRAGYGLALTADQHVANQLVEAVALGTDYSGETMPSLIGTTAAPKGLAVSDTDDSEAAYEFLVDLGTALDVQKIPRTPDRYAIVPPWLLGLLSKDIRFVGYGGAAGNTVITDGFAGQADANGLAGRAAGFNVISSLDVPTGAFNASGGGYVSSSDAAEYHTVIAGVPSATSFANQIIKTEAFRSQKRFSDVVRGLHVYGSVVTWPERVLGAYVAPGT